MDPYHKGVDLALAYAKATEERCHCEELLEKAQQAEMKAQVAICDHLKEIHDKLVAANLSVKHPE